MSAPKTAELGPHTTGKGCLYVKRLSDVDKPTLRKVIQTEFKTNDGKTITT